MGGRLTKANPRDRPCRPCDGEAVGAGVDLVERDALDLVFKEAELTALLGSGGGKQRARLGQWAKADALLLVSLAKRADKEFLQIVISDCRMGLRLDVTVMPFSTSNLDRSADEIARLVEDVRKRFASGAKQAIGVPRFVSKNVVYRFDHLQAGYARLVQQALVAVPGVAREPNVSRSGRVPAITRRRGPNRQRHTVHSYDAGVCRRPRGTMERRHRGVGRATS